MNFDSLYSDIRNICKSITKGSDLCEDLIQEVMILSLNIDDLEERYETEKDYLLTLIYSIAYKQYKWKGSPFNRMHNNTYYDASEKEWKYWNQLCTDDVVLSTESDDGFDVVELISNLSELESIWIQEYFKRNCSINKLSIDSKISRNSIADRLNLIFTKIRKQ